MFNDISIIVTRKTLLYGYHDVNYRYFQGENTTSEEDKDGAERTKVAEAEGEVDIDLQDPEVAMAAEKIQAGFRGLQDRKMVKNMKEKQAMELGQQNSPTPAANGQEDEEVDIDLEDPEVQKAAVTIQAGFKGLKTRKELKEKKEAAEGGQKTNGDADE